MAYWKPFYFLSPISLTFHNWCIKVTWYQKGFHFSSNLQKKVPTHSTNRIFEPEWTNFLRSSHLYQWGKQKKLHFFPFRLWEQHADAVKRLDESDRSKEITLASSIGQIDPPDLDKLKVNLLVTHVNTPNSFWVNYSEDKYNQMADDVQDAITIWMR